jgi:hypothetical protein
MQTNNITVPLECHSTPTINPDLIVPRPRIEFSDSWYAHFAPTSISPSPLCREIVTLVAFEDLAFHER